MNRIAHPPPEQLHVLFRRTLASPPAGMTAERLHGIKAALADLRWAIDQELAALLGAWPTSEVLNALAQIDSQRHLWIEIAILQFWLGQGDDRIEALQPPQEMRDLADRLLIREMEWEINLGALLKAMNNRGESHE